MTINFKELNELLAAIATNNITELTLKNADFELTVSQGQSQFTTVTTISTDASQQLAAAPTPSSSPTVVDRVVTPAIDKNWVEIKSPMVGTFYRSPAPDEPAFASSGDRIRMGQTVCIIEAMKLMNEIEAESAGQVMEVLVENGQPIEFGQVLMYVNPGWSGLDFNSSRSVKAQIHQAFSSAQFDSVQWAESNWEIFKGWSIDLD